MEHILLFIFCLNIPGLFAVRKLIYANIMFSHGHNAPPAQVYPKDTNAESAWPRGYAHLTNLGIQQSYSLGQSLRAAYTNNGSLLPNKYTVDVIDVLSSAHDRTLQSAEAVLAALYPPMNEQIWSNTLLWQPIPVHTTSESDPDPMLQPDDINCTNYNALLTKENANLTASMNQKYASFFRYLENQTGIARIGFENISNLNYIQNEIAVNLTQPTWLRNIRPDANNWTTLAAIQELTRIAQDQKFNSPAKAKFGAGLMLGQWIDNMKAVINNSASITKHESSISSMLNALGTGNYDLVPYAAAISMELYQDGNQYSVEAWYRNISGSAQTYPLQLATCKTVTNCTVVFTDFVKAYQNVTFATTDDYLQACGIGTVQSAANASQVVSIGVEIAFPKNIQIVMTHQNI